MADIEISAELGQVTRGTVPKESHLLPPPLPLANDTESNEDVEDEGDDVVDLTNDEVLRQLNELHSRRELEDPNLSLKEIPALYNEIVGNDPLPVNRPDPESPLLEDLENGDPILENLIEIPEEIDDPAAVDIRNILPERTRRRVRFNLPRLQN